MPLPRSALRTAVHERLSGDDGQGLGLSEPVFITGSVPEGQSAPYAAIQRPRTRGSNYIGGRERFEVRLTIRVHTRFPPGKVDQSVASGLATSIHDSLTGADLSVTGYRSPEVLTPDVNPVDDYDVGELRAYDLNLRYTFRFSN